MLNLYNVMMLATATPTGPKAPNSVMGMIVSFLPFVVLILLMYFLMIRPQRKKEKETMAMRKALQVGDEVTTVGGIVGIIVRKSEDNVVIETGGDRSKIRVKLWAIQSNETVHETDDK